MGVTEADLRQGRETRAAVFTPAAGRWRRYSGAAATNGLAMRLDP
jgi:hypothetical protein